MKPCRCDIQAFGARGEQKCYALFLHHFSPPKYMYIVPREHTHKQVLQEAMGGMDPQTTFFQGPPPAWKPACI